MDVGRKRVTVASEHLDAALEDMRGSSQDGRALPCHCVVAKAIEAAYERPDGLASMGFQEAYFPGGICVVWNYADTRELIDAFDSLPFESSTEDDDVRAMLPLTFDSWIRKSAK